MRLHTLENLNVAKTFQVCLCSCISMVCLKLGAEFVVFVPSYAFNP